MKAICIRITSHCDKQLKMCSSANLHLLLCAFSFCLYMNHDVIYSHHVETAVLMGCWRSLLQHSD